MACMNIQRKCIELLESGNNVAQVTVIKATRGTPGKEGFKLLLTEDGHLFGTVGGGALEHLVIEEAKNVLKTGENQILQYNLGQIGMECGGQATLVIEYLKAEKNFLLFGGGHVGQAFAPILESLGFHVTIFDSRDEIRELLSENVQTEVVIGDYNDISPLKEKVNQTQFCFIATHGHKHDYTVLKQILKQSDNFRYIGLIGSRKKIRTTLQLLSEEGMAMPEYLFAPVGINLGADTAAEIAVSIASEVVALLHDVPVNHMRLKLEDQ